MSPTGFILSLEASSILDTGDVDITYRKRIGLERKGVLNMQNTNNLQEVFLKEVYEDQRPVTIFLMNGYQLRGIVTGFDSGTVVLTSDGKQQVIYKHAISTIIPERPVDLSEEMR